MARVFIDLPHANSGARQSQTEAQQTHKIFIPIDSQQLDGYCEDLEGRNAALDPEAKRGDGYGRGGQPREKRVRTIDQACDVRAPRARLFLFLLPLLARMPLTPLNSAWQPLTAGFKPRLLD